MRAYPHAMIDYIQLPLKAERKTEKNSRAKPLGDVFDPAKERRVRAQLRLKAPDSEKGVVSLPVPDRKLERSDVVGNWLVVSAQAAKSSLSDV